MARCRLPAPVMRTGLITLLLFSGCIRISNLPDVGECAQYPDGTYEYGKIDIGLCLSGPNSMKFVGEDDNLTLMVGNANPYRLFTGGSLLSIPWANVDLGDEHNEVHTLDPFALALPSFAAGLAVNEDMGLIAIRESSDARTRVWDDSVLLLDLEDPQTPSPLNRGDNGSDSVKVMSDPVDVVVDHEGGMAFVANRTSHKISVLDLTGDNVVTIDPWPEAMVTAAAYKDNSGFDGHARLVTFDILDKDLLPDDTWTLTWIEGTWRLWTPGPEGLRRITTHMATDSNGAVTGTTSPMGIDVLLSDAPDSVLEIRDPTFFDLGFGRMLFSNGEDIWGATTGEYLGDWDFDAIPTIAGVAGEWNAVVSGPTVVPGIESIWMFFDGQTSDLGGDGPSAIGGAVSVDGLNWSPLEDPILEPMHDHESDHIADPHVFYDGETALWRMVYSAYDGTEWSIGHAVSDDAENWTSDDTPMFTGNQGAAAPVVHGSVGSWHLWYSEWTGEAWRLSYAWSPDTVHWSPRATHISFDADTVLDDPLRPPGIALSGTATDAFRVEAENLGKLQTPLEPGLSYAAVIAGWSIEVLAGAWLDLGDAGAVSNGGIQLDSVQFDEDASGTAWLTLTNRNGRSRIGRASIEDGLVADEGAIFEGGDERFERDGVSHPVVYNMDGQFHMLYAGTRNGRQKIGHARSEDGIVWSDAMQVFGTGNQDWEAVSVVPGSVVTQPSGTLRMWYSGFDGSRWRIGSASSEDGQSWSRDDAVRGFQFTAGAPGSWDDSGVKDPYVIEDESGEHLWYSGFDGDNWRIGYAFRAKGENTFERTIHSTTEEPRSVVGLTGGLFHRGGVGRPVVTADADGFNMFFAGSTSGNVRVGRAFGIRPDHFNKAPRRPRIGDQLVFDTQKGDADMRAIPLDGYHAERTTSGVGLTALHHDAERGMLFAVSKLHATIFAIDVRDDTDATIGFYDRNYLDVEAIILLNTSSAGTGFRQVLTIPGSNKMYALVDSPESVVSIDLSGLVDDEYADALYDVATGYLPTARGDERDKGHKTMSSVGPGQMLLHPDGRRLFVSNFNRNSITTYDLELGPYGLPVRETANVGENPYALSLVPNQDLLVFGNYVGEVEDDVAHSSLGVIDINETSPTYLEVLSWVVNR